MVIARNHNFQDRLLASECCAIGDVNSLYSLRQCVNLPLVLPLYVCCFTLSIVLACGGWKRTTLSSKSSFRQTVI